MKELRRWLDQAQGQLQNTQTALHEREEDCKTLEAAIDSLQAFKVCLHLQQCINSNALAAMH